MEIVCVGISHQTADVGTREKFAVPESDLPTVARNVAGLPGFEETVIVSTCNRVEFYAACADPADGSTRLREQMLAHAQGESSVPLYMHAGPEGIRHLFRVVSGLESMVLGETEILGQVKKAYDGAFKAGTTARHLNKLFQRAFNVAKEVRSHTNITRGPVSVGAAAVELAEKIFGRLNHCKVMILGAGQTGEQTARALLSRGVKSLYVANRNHEKANALAEEMGGAAVRFDEWEKWCDDMDILIGSTAASHAIVTRTELMPIMGRRPDRPLFLIDLAVPRDMDPSVNGLDGVYLYDIDALQAIANQSMNARRNEIRVCEQMIERHVQEFHEWMANAARFAPKENGAEGNPGMTSHASSRSSAS